MTMTKTILAVGVGGQGAILFSRILSEGLLRLGYDVKMSEIHGMSQRGGSVTTQIRYGKAPVYAPCVGEGQADMIVAFEKLEALRALPMLRPGGSMIVDGREIYPMPVLTGAAAYPHDALETLRAQVESLTVVPGADIAEELGSIRVQSVVLLGALVRIMGLADADWKDVIADMAPKKALSLNLAAFDAGLAG